METVGSADGSQIAYEWSGRGPALIVVNGALSDRRSGAPLARQLERDFTVYRYDRRGRGDSDDGEVYTVLQEVEDLAAVVDEAGGGPFVFGQSSGGALALEAVAAGAVFRGLVVHEPPYVAGPGTAPETADELERLVADNDRDEAVRRFLLGTGMDGDAIARLQETDGWKDLVALAHTLPYDVRMCNGGQVPSDRLAGVTVPVLATAGLLSPPWASAAAQAIAAAVNDGECRLLEDQSHVVAPDVLAEVLRERFLA